MRMSSCAVVAGLIGVLMGVWVGHASAQGLNPPPGPVAPTMKPLSDVEPRVAVNAANTPGDKSAMFVITRPGSYYLTASLLGEAGKSGIEIDASRVTLDLCGFDLKGVEGAVSGVRVRGKQTGVVVRNGSASGWTVAGIDVAASTFGTVEDVRSTGNGVGVLGGERSTVRRCVATGNTGAGGILTGRSATIENCTSTLNTGIGVYVAETSQVRGCIFEGNTTDGLYLDGGGCVITSCIAEANGRHGIAVIYGAAITDSTAEHNGGDGMWSIAAVTFAGCRSSFNAADGFEAGDGSTLTRCVARENGEDGLRLGNRVSASECHAVDQRNGAGIRAVGGSSRIEGNTLVANSIGVRVEGTGCLIVRNSSTSSTSKTEFDIGPGNAHGPIVNVAGIGNLGVVGGAEHPRANLVY